MKGGTTTGGSKTLPSSNSSPVHSVQPPPHSGAKPQGGARPTNGDTSEPISSAIVKYNYQAQQLDELSLVKGSRVMILEKSGDGWWRGQYGNKVTISTSVIIVSIDTCLLSQFHHSRLAGFPLTTHKKRLTILIPIVWRRMFSTLWWHSILSKLRTTQNSVSPRETD